MEYEVSRPAARCVLVRVSGALTQAGYQRALREAREEVAAGVDAVVVVAGRLNTDAADIDASALDAFADAWKSLDRVALVGTVAKYAGPAKWFGPPTRAQIKGFSAEREAEAIRWACGTDEG